MKNSQVLLIRYLILESINVRAAFIHVLGDLFQSIGVIIAAIIIKIKPEWGIVDPICTFIFCVIVLITTFGIIRDCIKVLMEGVPFGINTNNILNDLMKVKIIVYLGKRGSRCSRSSCLGIEYGKGFNECSFDFP